MFRYETICYCCKKVFFVEEGSNKYRLFKQNMQGKYSCEQCDAKVYQEARAQLFSKLT
ncbi:hypothetical protein [Solibacillus daqui]|uniref:hypothetical protein n=1 Tax=Solibacillus daqui TaxID=2912187 RepID=UPI002366EE32|nr:hypothetical protein [Solibacillus daqui]